MKRLILALAIVVGVVGVASAQPAPTLSSFRLGPYGSLCAFRTIATGTPTGGNVCDVVLVRDTGAIWTKVGPTALWKRGISTGDASTALSDTASIVRTTFPGGYADPAWLTSLAASKLTGAGTLPVSLLTGTLAAGQFPALTGDVTTVAGALATTIGPLKVTNAMLAGSIAAAKLVGTDIATVGTLTAGQTGAGFTVNLSTSTITGSLADARLSANVPLLNAANAFGSTMSTGPLTNNGDLLKFNVSNTYNTLPALTLDAAIAEIYARYPSSNNRGFLRLSAGGGTTSTFKSGIDITGFGDTDSNIVRIFTSGVERMRVSAGGAVSIGSATVTGTLDVRLLNRDTDFVHVSNAASYGLYASGTDASTSGTGFLGNFKYNHTTPASSVPMGTTADGIKFDNGFHFYSNGSLTGGVGFTPTERLSIAAGVITVPGFAGSGARCVHADNAGALSIAASDCATGNPSFYFTGTSTSLSAGCGNTATATGRHSAFNLNLAGSGLTSACTVTFSDSFTTAPICVATGQGDGYVVSNASTATTVSIVGMTTFGGTFRTFVNGEIVRVVCLSKD